MENWLPSLFYSREGLSSLRPFKILKGSMDPCKIPESTLTPSIIKEFGKFVFDCQGNPQVSVTPFTNFLPN